MVPSKSFAPQKQIIKSLVDREFRPGMRRKYGKSGQLILTENDYLAYQKNAFVENHQTEYLSDLYEVDYLLNPPRRGMSIDKVSSSLTDYYNGIWAIRLVYCELLDRMDFTISVICAKKRTGVPRYLFHPELIEKAISSRTNQATYRLWKDMAKRSIPELIQLVGQVQSQISEPIISIVCCDRSKHLCNLVGLPINRGFAIINPILSK